MGTKETIPGQGRAERHVPVPGDGQGKVARQVRAQRPGSHGDLPSPTRQRINELAQAVAAGKLSHAAAVRRALELP